MLTLQIKVDYEGDIDAAKAKEIVEGALVNRTAREWNVEIKTPSGSYRFIYRDGECEVVQT